MNDFAEEALTDEHMQRLQHDSELGCQSRYAGAGEESGGIEAYAEPVSESYEDEAPRKLPSAGVPLWYGDGEAKNLEAATSDALEWLKVLKGLCLLEASLARELDNTISALRLFGVKDAE